MGIYCISYDEFSAAFYRMHVFFSINATVFQGDLGDLADNWYDLWAS